MENTNEYRLNESSTKRCAEIYNSYAERFKLPKNFIEFKTDFEKKYGDMLKNGVYSSWEIQILFKTYIIDYIPVKHEEAERAMISVEKAAAGIANSIANSVVPTIKKMGVVGEIMDKAISKTEEVIKTAKHMYANGESYVKIGKELGVSDKTAKKYVES